MSDPLGITSALVDDLRVQIAALQDTLDLNNDEFARIAALESANSEIRQLCDRARRRTKQTVPLIEQLERAERNAAIISANAEAINGNANRRIRELEEDKCGLAADALNARQLLREFMAYVKCGQVPEDAHCARQAKRLLSSDLLDARVREGGGGGGSENLPPAGEKTEY